MPEADSSENSRGENTPSDKDSGKDQGVINEIPGFLVRWPNAEGELEEGPLSVLWQLIESYRVDIFEISLYLITEDFLSFMRLAGDLRVDLASSFAVMAARLLYYKSRALLPDPGFEESESDDRLPPELIQQLLEYRKFQQAADKLRELDELSSGIHTRKTPPTVRSGEEGADEEWLDLSLVDLVNAYASILKRLEERNPAKEGYEITLDEISVDDKMKRIHLLLVDAVSFTFEDLFENIEAMTRGEVIATFLAILEMVKQGAIFVQQKGTFGPIHIFRKDAVVH